LESLAISLRVWEHCRAGFIGTTLVMLLRSCHRLWHWHWGMLHRHRPGSLMSNTLYSHSLIIHHTVHVAHVLCIIWHRGHLLLVGNTSGHVLLPCLCVNLSSLQISTASHLSASLYGTQSKHIKVSLLLELLFVIRYLESVGDNSNTFGTIKRGIGNLCLER